MKMLARMCVYNNGCYRSSLEIAMMHVCRAAWFAYGAWRERGARACEREAVVSAQHAVRNMVLARPPRASGPNAGDRILIYKPQWLELVLSGQKTLEVRGAAYKSGTYYLGTGGDFF